MRYSKSGNVDVSPSYAGEHIRESDISITFGGDQLGFQLVVIENDTSDFEENIGTKRQPLPAQTQPRLDTPLPL